MINYLYILRDGEHYKIGVANNVRMRLSQLQTGNPRQIRIEDCYRFDDAVPIERALHQRFSDRRIYGEWFTLTDSDLVVLRNVCEQLGGIPQPEMEHQTVSSDELEEANKAEEIRENLDRLLREGWRIETWTQRQKSGNRYRYWQLTRRGIKNGRIRRYGGKIETLPDHIRAHLMDEPEGQGDGK